MKEKIKTLPEDIVFALDIGTRSVIGIVGTVENDKLKVIAIEQEEHTRRAMIDGQIEDIDQVAKLAQSVKNRLEAKLKCKLTRVCVAAAGRALKTQRASFELQLPKEQRITQEIISRLEAGAISEAETTFNNADDAEARRHFFLVGYSVLQYFLDDYLISSLKDHHGKKLKTEVIATFLPSEVVESLYSAMNKINLEISSLTLEPIAAINAAIPQELRLLNLVLVDIGAGTSDIAACRDGGIIGYTMATVAGDEITETLMKQYLIDFSTAEQIKFAIADQEELTFTDVLGIEQSATKEEISQCIEEPTKTLCMEIAEQIINVNNGAPSAVFLAGGGSKLPGIREGVAHYLNMDIKRVAIAGNNFKINAVSDSYDLNNPEYATPLGIAVSAALNLINDSFRVTLNGRQAKLFHSGSLTVLDILMMNGFVYQDLMGRSGQNLNVWLNGKRKVIYGGHAMPALLRLNGKDAKVSDIVKAGDVIEFIPAAHGKAAQASLADVLGTDVDYSSVTLNNETASPDTQLKSGDVILINDLEVDYAEELGISSKEAAAAAEIPAGVPSAPASAPPVPVAPAATTSAAPVPLASIPAAHIPAPTEAPASLSAGASPVTPSPAPSFLTPTETPVSFSAAAAPVTPIPVAHIPAPTEAPVSLSTGAAPVTPSPAPSFLTPDGAPVSFSAGTAPVTPSPAPSFPTPDRAPVSLSTEAAPVASSTAPYFLTPTETPVSFSAGTAPITPSPAPSFPTPDRAPVSLSSEAAPVTSSTAPSFPTPTETPVSFSTEAAPVTPSPAPSFPTPDRAPVSFSAGSAPVTSSTAPSTATVPGGINITLNDKPLYLKPKPNGGPYYLMDILEYSGLDFDHLSGQVNIMINGSNGTFLQELRRNDIVVIACEG